MEEERYVNFQVQEKQGTTGKWVWFSDFRSAGEAYDMMIVYQKFYPAKEFRVFRTS